MPAEQDDLDGIEAFAPHQQGSADDPFVTAFADDRRLGTGAAAAAASRARAGLVAAVLVLVAGLVSILAVGDDDGDELETSQPSIGVSSSSTSIRRPTTSSSLRPTVTFGTPTTPTTSLFGAGANPSVSTTSTSRRVPTTLLAPTTASTAPLGNQPLTVTITVEPAQPVVGEVASISVRYFDPDAPASTNCRSLDFGDGTSQDDPCVEPTCSAQGGAAGAGQGSDVTVVYNHIWTTAGDYDLVASGESLQPYCGDRFGSEASATHTVTVVDPPAAPAAAGAPSR